MIPLTWPPALDKPRACSITCACPKNIAVPTLNRAERGELSSWASYENPSVSVATRHVGTPSNTGV
jgi:hypothetical protein